MQASPFPPQPLGFPSVSSYLSYWPLDPGVGVCHKVELCHNPAFLFINDGGTDFWHHLILLKESYFITRYMFSEKIRQITLLVTNKCNSRCKHCNIWKIKEFDGEFKEDEFERIIAKSEMPNCFLMSLCGGESFMRPDLSNLFETVNRKYPKMHLSTVTNGYCTGLIVSRCKEIRKKVGDMFSICISIDGIGTTHDMMRGSPKSFENALKTSDELRKIGIRVFFNTTLTHLNATELPEVFRLAEKYSDGMWLGVYGAGQAFNQQEKELGGMALTHGDKKVILDQLKNKDELLLHGLYEFLSGKRIKCTAGTQSLVVSPTLEVFPCSNCGSSWSMGNLRDFGYDIESLLNSDKANKIRSLVRSCPERCFNLVASPSSLMDSKRFMISYKIRTKGLKWVIKQLPRWLFRQLGAVQ